MRWILVVLLMVAAPISTVEGQALDDEIMATQAKLDSLKEAARWDSTRAVEQTATYEAVSDSLVAIKKVTPVLDTLGVKVMKADGSCTFYCSLGGGRMGWYPARDGQSVYIDVPESKSAGIKLLAIKSFINDAVDLGGHYPMRDSTGIKEILGRVYMSGQAAVKLMKMQ